MSMSEDYVCSENSADRFIVEVEACNNIVSVFDSIVSRLLLTDWEYGILIRVIGDKVETTSDVMCCR